MSNWSMDARRRDEVASTHQRNVSDYHAAVAGHAHHGGHDMHIFHRDWHEQNVEPPPPNKPDPTWGMNEEFGRRFLEMHHEMVKAPGDQPHHHMNHDSIAAWYVASQRALPGPWDPRAAIPEELGYEPDLATYPKEIRDGVRASAESEGMTPEQWLRRDTDHPNFTLPRYFTREGVGPHERGDPITGARKLADFRNVNQLGCSIVYPHNVWHGTIGGAMRSTWTAIADPIFYFGVHWEVDRVFDEYKAMQSERGIRKLDVHRLRETNALPTEQLLVPDQFDEDERRTIEGWVAQTKKLRQPLR